MSVAPIPANNSGSSSNQANAAGNLGFSPVPPEVLADQREIIKAVKAVNPAELFGENSELTFIYDREARRIVVRIVDSKTHEVRMQTPPEYVLQLARVKSGSEAGS